MSVFPTDVTATSSPTSTSSSSVPAVSLPPVLPTAPGSKPPSQCKQYANYITTGNDAADTLANSCSYVSRFYDVTTANLKKWNPSLQDTEPCALSEGYRYCVSLQDESPTKAPPTSTSSATGVLTPTPTQDGIVSNCNQFYMVKTSDGCYAIATSHGLTLEQFYSYNPAVGSDCSTLYPDYYVCVSVKTAASPTTTATPTPTPTQDGMVSNYNQFYMVETGDGCYAIATSHGLTLEQFYSYNPAVGSDCSTLYPDYYVCVGVKKAASPTTTM
ncbi:LysM domain-containing protein [Aspergillus sp. HF37]|nr:LysM domain-containing protein [Aspergillus sp. HF37]